MKGAVRGPAGDKDSTEQLTVFSPAAGQTVFKIMNLGTLRSMRLEGQLSGVQRDPQQEGDMKALPSFLALMFQVPELSNYVL